MNLRLITIILLLTVSCQTQTSGWQTLDFGMFKLKTPQGWKKFEEKGIDSYVGGLTSGKDSLWFDYGWYSAEIESTDFKTQLYAIDTINGLNAFIEIPKIDGQGSIRLSIPKVNSKDKFNLGGYNIRGTEKILQIFKSIIFKESDTTKNSKLTLAKFRDKNIASGQMLFNQNCAACHHKYKTYVGPPLNDELINTRTKEWLMTFFLDRNNLNGDSAYKARKQFFGNVDCIEFDKSKKQAVEQLILYLKGQ